VLILICCDTSGNHKLKHAFIGKSKKELCLQKFSFNSSSSLAHIGIYATKEHECFEELCTFGFVLNSLQQQSFLKSRKLAKESKFCD
jgi:hypothetical protein